MTNPKTTWTGIGVAVLSALTILAALPGELGDVAEIIPPLWKPKIVAIGLIATLVLRVWKAQVTADAGVTQVPPVSPTSPAPAVLQPPSNLIK